MTSTYFNFLCFIQIFFKLFLQTNSMKISLKLIALVLVILAICAKAMRVRERVGEAHLTETQKHQAIKLVHMALYSTIHSAYDHNASGDIDLSGPFGDFFTWLMADKEILNSVMASTPMSQKSADKVKKYLMDHPQVIDSFLPQSPGGKDDDFQRCIVKFNPQQKKKFYGIFLDELDFKNMFVKNSDIGKNTNEKMSKASQKIMNDKELGPIFTACVMERKK